MTTKIYKEPQNAFISKILHGNKKLKKLRSDNYLEYLKFIQEIAIKIKNEEENESRQED
jgi:hypothetical protein